MSVDAKRPSPTAGMRHIALFVEKFDETVTFYTQFLGMVIEWQPDADNVYLTSGNDNLALHRYSGAVRPAATQRLDHIGFIIDKAEQVDQWCEFLKEQGVRIKKQAQHS